MALAANVKQYFPPKNIAQMEADLSLLPLWWAEEGDAVLMENGIGNSEESAKGTTCACFCLVKNSSLFTFPSYLKLCERTGHEYIPCPWGWNKAIKEKFRRFGVPEYLMPTDEALDDIRRFASREFACDYIADLLAVAKKEGWGDRLLGEEMRFVKEKGKVKSEELSIRFLPSSNSSLFPIPFPIIIKSPWSSSGRGVFVAKTPLSESDIARCNKFLSSQGGFLVDRFYDKVLDFAMEFEVKADGTVDFLGYSVFETAEGGKYGGNLVASQEELRKKVYHSLSFRPKRSVVEKSEQEASDGCSDVSTALDMTECETSLIAFHKKAISHRMGGRYTGIVGIDMLVDRNGFVHPCIEINVRMNMGVVAMRLYERLGDKGETVLTPERKHGFNAKVSHDRLFQLYFSS